jgi:hypothetical protein
MKWKYWCVFAVCQLLGIFIPLSFWNIHTNSWPLFAGVLLTPGIEILLLRLQMPTYYGAALTVLLNAGFWYLGFKSWQQSRT